MSNDNFPMMAEPNPVWTGPYAGVQIGGGVLQDKLGLSYLGQSVPTFGLRTKIDSSGVLGGGHVGYNLQHSTAVLGAEADFEGTGLRGTLTDADERRLPGYSASATTDIEWQGSIRARAGVTFSEPTLVYVTGGFAFASVRNTQSVTLPAINILGVTGGTYSERFSDVKYGYTVGGGFEHQFASNITAGLEYRFTDLGKFDTASTYVPGGAVKHNLLTHTVRLGVSYHF